jgi:predicted TIM-barrel fold metal-dependent hydrolase
MLIDVHSHYMPAALARALEKRTKAPRIVQGEGGSFIEYGEGSKTLLAPVFSDPAQILERMDEARIDHALLSVTIPGVDWLDDAEGEEVADASNRETADIARRHPDRFSGLATVPLQAPERAVGMLRRAVAMGLKGAMIYSNVAGRSLDEPSRRVFFDTAAELDVPIMLHPTYPLCAPTVMTGGLMEMAGFLFDTTTAALRLVFDGLYERNPGFKLLVPHTGSLVPYFAGRIDLVAGARPGAAGALTATPSSHLRKFYVDTVTGSPASVRFCCDFFGIDQVMHGTDHPFWPMTLGPRLLDEVGLSAGDRAKIEHENAARLFRIEVPARRAHHG